MKHLYSFTYSSLFVLPFALCFALCLVLFSGCGEQKPDGMPKLYPVSLTFQQDGKPLTEAAVILIPQFSCGWTIGGLTNASGNVILKTHGKYEGAPAGKFKICVSKTISEGELPSMDLNKPTKPMMFYEAVEPQYAKEETTPLEIEIAAKNSQRFPPFDCGKEIKTKQAAPSIN